MKVGVFNCNQHDIDMLTSQNVDYGLEMAFFNFPLSLETANLAQPFDAVAIGATDDVNAEVLDKLLEYDVHHIALRCAGFNHVDVKHAKKIGISISRVPNYSQSSVAEHTVALVLALSRKLCDAQRRIKDNNYSLQGLLGFDLSNATVGIVGTGRIGMALVKILHGFGCRILCCDPIRKEEITKMGHEYVALDDLVAQSNIISLQCPLTKNTEHIIDYTAIKNMKPNVMIINTSRCGLMNMKAVISGLKSQKIGYLGIDIYEMESELDGEDIACKSESEHTFQRLLTFPNVIVTAHNAFYTQESMQVIADTMLQNLQYYFIGKVCDETFLV